MQLTEVFCFALLAITLSSVCVQADNRHELQEHKIDKRLRRRETTVLIDSYPTERMHHKPKVIYRRLSKHRYGPKPKYGPPRPKHRLPKPSRRPTKKKYYGKSSSKPGYPYSKKSQKPRYGPPTKKLKPIYGPPKKKPFRTVHRQQDPAGFGEPPIFDHIHDSKPEIDFQNPTLTNYLSSKPSHGEPPVDSYGAPIQPGLHDLTYPSAHSFQQTTAEGGIRDYGQEHLLTPWETPTGGADNSYAPTKNKPSFMKTDNIFVTPVPSAIDENEELNLNSYSDIFVYRQNKNEKNAKHHYINHVKMKNQPWKGNKYSSKIEDEVIVGGKYAEPPARYIPRHENIPYDADDNIPLDPEVVASASNSKYVNYKNTNMAFSPQNLNDAFSIVD